MSEILSTLAFALMMSAQFFAVVAVHRLKHTQADHTTASEMPGLSDHNLFLTAERLHQSRDLKFL
jgi:hypothetical protein